MANKQQPRGMRPYGEVRSINPYKAAGTIYPGDTVAADNAGNVARSITVPLRGVALNYALAGEVVMVADDPNQLFVVESNGATAQADVNLNSSLNLGTPSTAYKLSGLFMDNAANATTATLAVKILAPSPAIDNEVGVINTDVIVKINNHDLASGTGSVGI